MLGRKEHGRGTQRRKASNSAERPSQSNTSTQQWGSNILTGPCLNEKVPEKASVRRQVAYAEY